MAAKILFVILKILYRVTGAKTKSCSEQPDRAAMQIVNNFLSV